MPEWLKNKGQELAGLVMEDETAFMTSAIKDTLENVQADVNSKFQEDSIIGIDEETDIIRLDGNVPSEAQEDIDSKSKEDSLHIFMDQETAFMTTDAKDTLETIQDDIDSNHQEDIFSDMPVLVARHSHDDSSDNDSSDNDFSKILNFFAEAKR